MPAPTMHALCQQCVTPMRDINPVYSHSVTPILCFPSRGGTQAAALADAADAADVASSYAAPVAVARLSPRIFDSTPAPVGERGNDGIMNKRLIVCFDGTWNDRAAQNTNVWRLSRLVSQTHVAGQIAGADANEVYNDARARGALANLVAHEPPPGGAVPASHSDGGDDIALSSIIRPERSAHQLVKYIRGVGTTVLSRLQGGAFGDGIDAKIRQGCEWRRTLLRCHRYAARVLRH